MVPTLPGGMLLGSVRTVPLFPSPATVNLPNAITVGRIALTPLVAWLPFTASWSTRLAAFVLLLVAAITDYWDGHLARQRNLVTDLGRLLDPLADKLLLVATLVPMYMLQRHASLVVSNSSISQAGGDPVPFLFATPLGHVSLPLWIVLVVLGRELFMTVFRQVAARRGLVIAAIGPAKLKTVFQLVWMGSAYFWFFALTLASSRGWEGRGAWQVFAQLIGVLGVTSMAVAVLLTLYSLWLYVRRYGLRVLAA